MKHFQEQTIPDTDMRVIPETCLESVLLLRPAAVESRMGWRPATEDFFCRLTVTVDLDHEITVLACGKSVWGAFTQAVMELEGKLVLFAVPYAVIPHAARIIDLTEYRKIARDPRFTREGRADDYEGPGHTFLQEVRPR